MCYNLAAVHPPPTTAVSVRQTCVASEEIQESRQSCVTFKTLSQWLDVSGSHRLSRPNPRHRVQPTESVNIHALHQDG